LKKLITVLLILGFTSIIAYSGPRGSGNAPGQEVKPFTVDVSKLPFAAFTNILAPTHERGASPFPVADINPSIYNTPATQDLPNKVTGVVLKSWAGPNQNGWQPADPDIAVSQLYVVVVTNEQFHIYDRTTNLNLLSTNTFQNFFNRPGKSIFDPKIIWDPWRNRFVMLALEKDGLSSYYWVAISQTTNPTGTWWVYQLNAHVDGSTTTQNWADYPGLGFTSQIGALDSGAVIITSNQFSQASAFQYAKIRCLNVNQLYAGAAVNWWDFTNITDADAQKSFTVKPAAHWFSTGGATCFLMNTKAGGGSVINVRNINNPHRVTTGPTLSSPTAITVTAYAIPPSSPRPGGGTIDAGDNRTQDVIYMVGRNSSGVQKGFLYHAMTTKYNWGAGDNANVFYTKLNVTDNTVDIQGSFGFSGSWYVYPKVAPHFKGTYFGGDSAIIVFERGSLTEYMSARVTGHDRIGSFGSSASVRAGTGNYGDTRNGDYNGICIDPYQTGRLWSIAMIDKTGGWGTGVGYLDFQAGSVGISGNNGEIPSSYKLEQNYPNPFNPVTSISYSIIEAGFVKLTVYDLSGKEIKTLVSENKTAGNYNVSFNASGLASGVYFYRLTANKFSETKKMIVTK